MIVAGSQALAVGGKRHALDRRLVTVKSESTLTSGDFTEMNDVRCAGTVEQAHQCQAVARRGESNLAGSFRKPLRRGSGRQQLAPRQPPGAHAAGAVGRTEGAAVVGELQRPGVALISFQSRQFLAGRDVPDPDGVPVLLPTGGEDLSVGREYEGINLAFV